MNIGAAANTTGLPAKTIRYYEEVGLITPDRSSTGYRIFNEAILNKLRFIGRARNLGFSVEDCRLLLSLYEDQSRESGEVRAIAKNHLSKIEGKIRELTRLHQALEHLIDTCAGDHMPDCPIIDDLAGGRVRDPSNDKITQS